MRLKICGVTRRSDAEYLDGRVDYIGFIPDTSGGARSVALDRAMEIRGAVKQSIPVAVFSQMSIVDAIRVASLLGVGVIQHPALGSREGLDLAVKLGRGLRFAPVIYVSPDAPARAAELLDRYGDYLEYVLIDAPKQGFDVYERGLKFPLELLRGISGMRVGVAGGISPSNVAEVAAMNPFLIDISSGVESSPGIKDPAKVEAIRKVIGK